MSVKKPQLIFLILLAIGFGLVKLTQPKPMVRPSFLGQVNVSQYSSQGIVDRVIQLKLRTENLTKSGETEITANIILPFDLREELHFKWTLGQNVILQEGLLEGISPDGIKKNQIEKIKITVKGYTVDQLRHIGFEVWALHGERRLYADGLISSQQEKSFENIVQHVEKMKAQKLGISK